MPFLISFVVYLFTLAPSVIQIDAGELATVQAIGGIAHPTGYPLFTILGYLFLHLPLPFTKIFAANLLSTIYCSVTVLIFTYSVKMILVNFSNSLPSKSHKSDKKESQPGFEIENWILITSVIAGSFFLAFSKTFWFQSTSVEVYALHALLINLIIFILLKILVTVKDKNETSKFWFVFSSFLALGFANHLTTVLIVPAVAYVYFYSEKISAKSFFLLIKMILLFTIILIALFSYLPIRASFNPALNWGNPRTFENFFRHFEGAQYSTWIFSSFESAKKQFIYFITNLPGEFTYPGLILILIGIGFTFRFQKELFYFFGLCAIACIAYSINYDIVDIDSYFLLAYISFSFFAVFGFLTLMLFLRKRFIKEIILIVVALPLLYLGWKNFNETNQSDMFIFEDYTKGILNSVEKESIIFSYQWDYFISASYYFQLVENFRKDVTVIDKELLRRSWYYDQLQNNFPDVVRGQEENIRQFKNALIPFERGGKFNPNLLEHYYQAIMTGLIADNIEKRSYYIGAELYQNEMRNNQFRLPDGYQIVPDLFLFKVVKGNNYVPAPDPDFIFRRPNRENKYTDFINSSVYNMLTMRALYELSFNKIGQTKKYVSKLKNLFPNKPLNKNLNVF